MPRRQSLRDRETAQRTMMYDRAEAAAIHVELRKLKDVVQAMEKQRRFRIGPNVSSDARVKFELALTNAQIQVHALESVYGPVPRVESKPLPRWLRFLTGAPDVHESRRAKDILRLVQELSIWFD